MGTKVLGEIPLVPLVSTGSDAGVPITLRAPEPTQTPNVQGAFRHMASIIYAGLFGGNPA